jgi:hypothetical protein
LLIGVYGLKKTRACSSPCTLITLIASVGMNSTEQCDLATKSASIPYAPAHRLSSRTVLLPIASLRE